MCDGALPYKAVLTPTKSVLGSLLLESTVSYSCPFQSTAVPDHMIFLVFLLTIHTGELILTVANIVITVGPAWKLLQCGRESIIPRSALISSVPARFANRHTERDIDSSR